jgi:hypothetical protein
MKTLQAETLTNKSLSIQKVLVAVDLSDHSETRQLSSDFSRKPVQHRRSASNHASSCPVLVCDEKNRWHLSIRKVLAANC